MSDPNRVTDIGRQTVTLGGHNMDLVAGGGVFWPAEKTLFVADTHFGKDATFRRAAIAVPNGSTDATIGLLTQMIDQTCASQIVFLGDLFHAKNSLSTQICDTLESFWATHPDRRFVLVRGNHDAAVGRLPTHWPLADVGPKWQIKDVALEHFPAPPPADCRLLLCGHLHPAVRLRHGDDKMGKLPCFWLSKGTMVLPAMGQFTGTSVVSPKRGDRIWISVENRVIEFGHEAAGRSKRRHPV